MRKSIAYYSVVFASTMLLGCAFGTVKQETGRPIDENTVNQIVIGKTTSSDILSWFGAPTNTAQLGTDQLFTYKYCKNKGGSCVVPFLSSVETKECCNELTIVFYMESGIVKNYDYKKQIPEKKKRSTGQKGLL